jgi:hypothetical protein
MTKPAASCTATELLVGDTQRIVVVISGLLLRRILITITSDKRVHQRGHFANIKQETSLFQCRFCHEVILTRTWPHSNQTLSSRKNTSNTHSSEQVCTMAMRVNWIDHHHVLGLIAWVPISFTERIVIPGDTTNEVWVIRLSGRAKQDSLSLMLMLRFSDVTFLQRIVTSH